MVANPSAVVLSVWAGVGGCLCPIAISIVRASIIFLELVNSAPISASVAEDIACFSICALMRTAPLIDELSDLLDSMKCPPARLLARRSER